ncbi:hypothetical protein [Microlunatus ginsengisoli]|uniref:Uncharacterized protein n=1 Tax=Microlunatus ginsengisoli TaxID=363863 RepID=A0ABP7AQ92_9ACTN
MTALIEQPAASRRLDVSVADPVGALSHGALVSVDRAPVRRAGVGVHHPVNVLGSVDHDTLSPDTVSAGAWTASGPVFRIVNGRP